MFPVISNLRRSAMKIIYTSTPEVRMTGKHFCFDFSTGKWSKSTNVPMSILKSSGDTEIERAVSLCVFENETYENSKASSLQYTLVMGPETEDGEVRSVPIGIVKGILMTKNDSLRVVRAREDQPPLRKPLPPGVVLDER